MALKAPSPSRHPLVAFGRLLALPWQAHDRGQRWFMRTLLALALVLAVTLSLLPGSRVAAVLAAIVGVLDGMLWAFFLPLSVRLVRTARHLRLPRMERHAHASLLVYLVLGSVVPGWLLGFLGAPTAVVIVSLVAVCAGALLYATLPIVVTVTFCFLPTMLPAVMHGGLDFFPHPTDPAYVPVMGLLATSLLLLAAVRWLQVCSRPSTTTGLWRRPLADILQHKVGFTGMEAGKNAESAVAGQRPGWLQPCYVLAGTGPCDPRRSLRVAIGSAWTPATFTSRLRPLLLGLGSIAASLVFTAFLLHRQFDGWHAFWSLFTLGVGWFFVFIAIVHGVASLLMLRQRWSLTRAELPLLALLPGLGKRIKSDLLDVCLARILPTWNVLLVLAWMLMTYGTHDVHADTLVWIAGMLISGNLLIVAGFLGVLGHVRIGLWTRTGLTLGLLAIGLGTGGVQLATRLDWTPAPAGFDLAVRIALWCLLGFATLAFIQHAWRRWQDLPHPFLPLSN